jgi:hypothetical protein
MPATLNAVRVCTGTQNGIRNSYHPWHASNTLKKDVPFEILVRCHWLIVLVPSRSI